jgi:hypothetical protein
MNTIAEIKIDNFADSDSGSDTFAADVTASWARSMARDNAEQAFIMQVMKNNFDNNTCLLGDEGEEEEEDEKKDHITRSSYYYPEFEETSALDEEVDSDLEADNGEADLEDIIANWKQFLDDSYELEQRDNYENCKYQLQCVSSWSQIEKDVFIEYIAKYEEKHPHLCHDENTSLWQQYSLTYEDYNAQLVYEGACEELEDYYKSRNCQDEEEEEEIEYRRSLEAIIDIIDAKMDKIKCERAGKDDEEDCMFERAAF